MRKTIDHVNQMPATAAGEASSDDVFEAIHAVMHLYRAARYHGGASDLTHMEGRVLGFFARHPGATQKDLSSHSGRDKGQLARLIGSLRERGLLDAQPDAQDRRSIRLQPTAAGRALLKTLERQGRRLAEQAVADISPAERQQLMALLARVRGNLERAG